MSVFPKKVIHFHTLRKLNFEIKKASNAVIDSIDNLKLTNLLYIEIRTLK